MYIIGPFKDYPLVIVYHPATLGHPFINVGFVGWIACLSGKKRRRGICGGKRGVREQGDGERGRGESKCKF